MSDVVVRVDRPIFEAHSSTAFLLQKNKMQKKSGKTVTRRKKKDTDKQHNCK